jgi:hypothetical protein
LEKLHLQTIDALRANVEKQQANGVSAKWLRYIYLMFTPLFSSLAAIIQQ